MKRMCAVMVACLAATLVSAQPVLPGFSTYLVGFMTRAASELPAGASLPELQKAHLANLTKMWQDGLLLASGPIGDKGDLRGVLILVDDRSTVEKRLANDPLVRAGQLKVALIPWMAPSDIGVEYKKWAATNPGAPDKMHTYQLGLMRPVKGATPMTSADQRAHMLNINAMAKLGKLVAAGPILGSDDLEGLFVFDAPAAEADALAASDPGVKMGKFTVERHPWLVAEGVMPKGFKVPVP